jgi:DNA/RNA-binding domain of Phe-tRNA-synthetase-like protein
MPTISIAAVVERFPEFRVAVLRAGGLTIHPERSIDLASWVKDAEHACRADWAGVELSAIPAIAAWRTAYRGFGIKKTSYRSSVERLIKRVLAGEELPRINALVDLYNCVSLAHGLCLGADDLDNTCGDLAFRYAQPKDTFLDMSAGPGESGDDPPKDGEVVYADSRHVLCRRWNWRQDGRTMVGAGTKNAVLTIQSNGFGDVEAAAEAVVAGISAECHGRSSVVLLDRSRPVAEF